jgi:MFS family permease
LLPILFFTVFIDLVGFGIVLPFLAYYVESFGARASTVGLLMSTYSLAQFVFAPIWGRLSDRVGRRPILLLGLFGSVAGYTLFGLAGSLFMLFAGRAIMGVFGATIPTAQAAVADVTTPENRARGMGTIGAAIGLGFILGPALGGVLAAMSAPASRVTGIAMFVRNPYAFPSLCAAALAATNLIAAVVILPESLQRSAAPQRVRASRFTMLSEALGKPSLRALVTIFFLFMMGFTMMESTMTLFIEHRIDPGDAGLVRRIGLLFGFIGVVMAVLQGMLIGRLSRAFGEARLLKAGLAIAGIGLVALPFAHSWDAVYACAFALATGMGLTQPTNAALISRAAEADVQGGTLGVSQSAASLARVLGPVLAGSAFDRVAPGAPFAVGAAIVGASMLVSLQLSSTRPA